MVPTGTGTSLDAPSRPDLLLPSPCRPRSASCSGLKRKCNSVLWCWLATKITSPPLPPSPPLGPPCGTNFSRRNARQPLPPSPALIVILTSSTSMKKAAEASGRTLSVISISSADQDREPELLRGFDRDSFDVNEFTHSAPIAEL